MKRKIILAFIVTAIILSSCSLGENKVSSSKNSNVASGTVISDNKETEGNTQSNSLEKEIDEKITEDTIITELKKGKFEYKETVKKVIEPVKNSDFEGYSDKGVYFSSSKKHNEMLDGGLCDTTYYITDEKGSREVYKVNNNFYGIFKGIYEGDLIVGFDGGLEKEEETDWRFSIHRIGANGGEIICKGIGWKLMETQIIGDSLVYYVSNLKKGVGILNKCNLKTKETEEIVKYKYKENEQGELLQGKRVYALDGFKDGVIFRIEIADKKGKDVEKGRKWETLYYDFNDKSLTELPIKHERTANYIGGDKDCVIIGDIDVDNTTDNIGTMYLKKEDGSYANIILPEIESCDDIKKGIKISDSIIGLLAGGKIYLLDYKKGSYEIINGYGMFEQDRIVIKENNEVHIYENFK